MTVTGNLYGQDDSTMRYLVNGGVSINQLTGSDVTGEFGSGVGFNLGFTLVDIYYVGQVSMDAGARFNMKGFTLSFSEPGDGYYYQGYEFKMDAMNSYIEVYGKAKYNLGSESFTLQPFVGLNFGLLVSDKATIKDSEYGSETVELGANSTDFSVMAGLDTFINERIMLGLEIHKGFSDVYKDLKASNLGFIFHIGYLF
jgi:hypothetical protein